MTPILHDWELSGDCYAVRLGAALMGVALERRGVDVHPGAEHRGAAFRSLNPRGTLPVLVDGAATLTSAPGALGHLARTRAPGWLPCEQGAALDWLCFAARDLAASEAARQAALFDAPDRAAEAAARRALRLLDRHLAERGFEGRSWIVGEAPSIVDVACFPAVALAVDWGETLEDMPPLRAWTRRLRALPGFVAMPGVPEFL